MLIALVLIVALLAIPGALGVFGLLGSLVWPHRWDLIAKIISAAPVGLLLVGLGHTIVTEDQEGTDAGPLAAVQLIFMSPFLAWYFGFIWGGAYLGRWLSAKWWPRARSTEAA